MSALPSRVGDGTATARGDEPVAVYVQRLGRSGDKRDVAAILDLIVELEERGSALRMPDARIINRSARISSPLRQTGGERGHRDSAQTRWLQYGHKSGHGSDHAEE